MVRKLKVWPALCEALSKDWEIIGFRPVNRGECFIPWILKFKLDIGQYEKGDLLNCSEVWKGGFMMMGRSNRWIVIPKNASAVPVREC